MNISLENIVLADAKSIVASLSLNNPALVKALSDNPAGLEMLGELVLQVSRIKVLCAFECAVDLDGYSPSLQSILDRIPQLSVVLRHFLRSPCLKELNSHLPPEDLRAAEARFDDYLGSFLL